MRSAIAVAAACLGLGACSFHAGKASNVIPEKAELSGTLRAVTSFSAWLFAVARRACLRLLRRSIGLAEKPIDDVEARLVYLPAEELRIDLSRAIQSLPDHYREVILLRDIEELSIDEICAVLALTRESVKARIHRARLMIREYLVRE